MRRNKGMIKEYNRSPDERGSGTNESSVVDVVVERRDESEPANTPVLLRSATVRNGFESERATTSRAMGMRRCEKGSTHVRFVFFLLFCFFSRARAKPLTVSECQDTTLIATLGE